MCRFSTILAFFILALSFSIRVNGQEVEVKKSTVVRSEAGKKFLTHKVEPKQTLYSISRVYGVTISEISFENPEILKGGIQPGQELKIPFSGEVPTATPVTNPIIKGKTHTVSAGETWYGIAKLYNIALEDLRELNPETTILQPGNSIKLLPDKAKGANTESDKPFSVVSADKSAINFVTLLLPFYLNENSFNDTVETKVADNSRNAIEFYQGVLMAIDSLKNLGISFNISVYDLVNDTNAAKQIVKKQNVRNSNLIIGPFYNSTFEIVARFAKETKIPLVSPMIQNSKILLGNPTVSKVVPNNASQCEVMAEYIAKTFEGANVILLHNGLSTELNLITSFKNKYKAASDEKVNSPKEINYKTESFTGVQSALSISKQNILVCFSVEQIFISQLLPKIESKLSDYKILVFGQAIWKNFDNIELDIFSKVNLHLPANYFVDYENPDVKSFVRKFREKNQAEPSQMAFLGFDICYYYLNLLNNRGMNFHTTLWQTKGQGLSTGFEFFRDNPEKGYENKATSILKYEDNKLIKVK
jgi:LysM repeat protein/ABC-type branched-subunit amino acid transport system substrate-binding protein